MSHSGNDGCSSSAAVSCPPVGPRPVKAFAPQSAAIRSASGKIMPDARPYVRPAGMSRRRRRSRRLDQGVTPPRPPRSPRLVSSAAARAFGANTTWPRAKSVGGVALGGILGTPDHDVGADTRTPERLQDTARDDQEPGPSGQTTPSSSEAVRKTPSSWERVGVGRPRPGGRDDERDPVPVASSRNTACHLCARGMMTDVRLTVARTSAPLPVRTRQLVGTR